jgi:hypothetical protein
VDGFIQRCTGEWNPIERNKKMGLSVEERQIMYDYDRASAHAQKYIMPFLLQIQARGLMIESAARTFQEFTKLPRSSSTLLQFLDLAWSTVSLAVPALRVVGLLRQAQIAAQLTEASAAAGVMLIQKSPLGRVSRVVEKIGKVKEQTEKVVGIPEKGKTLVNGDAPGIEVLAKLDVSKRPIKELFEGAKEMVATWNRTIDFLVQEKAVRLANPAPTYPETLLSYAQKRLPPPEIFTATDLEQIETEHLWLMIGSWVKDTKVTLEESQIGSLHWNGINDTQRQALWDLFATATRGRYFLRPFYPTVYLYLTAFGASYIQSASKPIEDWRPPR